jgi:uncharacterized protein
MKPLFARISSVLATVLIALVYTIRFTFAIGPGPRCRYFPCCSEYTVSSLKQHGPFAGLVLGTWRVLRCNPWSGGGVDPVPNRFQLTCCGRQWPRSYRS